jgi:hypothetical protein
LGLGDEQIVMLHHAWVQVLVPLDRYPYEIFDEGVVDVHVLEQHHEQFQNVLPLAVVSSHLIECRLGLEHKIHQIQNRKAPIDSIRKVELLVLSRVEVPSKVIGLDAHYQFFNVLAVKGYDVLLDELFPLDL